MGDALWNGLQVGEDEDVEGQCGPVREFFLNRYERRRPDGGHATARKCEWWKEDLALLDVEEHPALV